MKAFVLAVILAVALSCAKGSLYTTEDIVEVKKDTYWFCIPVGTVPTKHYTATAQFFLESPGSISVDLTGDGKFDISLDNEVAQHVLDLRTPRHHGFGRLGPRHGPHQNQLPGQHHGQLPGKHHVPGQRPGQHHGQHPGKHHQKHGHHKLFNELLFKTSGCFSGTVHSKVKLVKVALKLDIRSASTMIEVPNAAQTCAKAKENVLKGIYKHIDFTHKKPNPTNPNKPNKPNKPDTHPKHPSYRLSVMAMASLSTGAVFILCSIIGCLCLCVQRCKGNKRQNTTVQAQEELEPMVVSTEQVAANEDNNAAPAPAPFPAGFYYIPANINGIPYTPMQVAQPIHLGSGYPAAMPAPIQLIPVPHPPAQQQ